MNVANEDEEGQAWLGPCRRGTHGQTRSAHLVNLYLLMVDGYEQTGWLEIATECGYGGGVGGNENPCF